MKAGLLLWAVGALGSSSGIKYILSVVSELPIVKKLDGSDAMRCWKMIESLTMGCPMNHMKDMHIPLVLFAQILLEWWAKVVFADDGRQVSVNSTAG